MTAPASYNLSRLDAAENFFFARELEEVRARSYDVKYAELKARMLIPVDNSVDTGAENVTYSQFDRVGVAKIIANYATDFPRADVKGKQFTQAIKSLGSSYGYNVQEIRGAKFAQKPLEQRKADAARKAIEEAIDKIGSQGDSANGLQGFTGITNAQTYSVPNGASNTPDWASKTSKEILADLNGIAHLIVTNTFEVEKPDTIVIPIAQYTLIATKQFSEHGNSDLTVLKFFLMNSPYIKEVVPWDRVRAAGTAGVDRMVCYRRDPDALQMVIPQEFEQFAPEQDGMDVRVACHARIGGVVAYYPMSIAYGDGV